MGVSRAGTVLQLAVSPQVSCPPAVSTTEAARICVCSPTKAMSTVPVEGAGSSRRTSPAGVRKLAGARAEAARGHFFQSWTRAGPQLMEPSPSPATNSSCRAQDEFECANGECISFSLTCDGVSHCKDKSDEKPSYCSKEPLQPLLLSDHGPLGPSPPVPCPT